MILEINVATLGIKIVINSANGNLKMAKYDVTPTGVERTFANNEFIVSKTDTTGRLMYINKTFTGPGINGFFGKENSKNQTWNPSEISL